MILREANCAYRHRLGDWRSPALGAAQAAKSLLYGLQPRDPLTLVMAVVTLTAVAALRQLLAAYRAPSSILLQPLRYE